MYHVRSIATGAALAAILSLASAPAAGQATGSVEGPALNRPPAVTGPAPRLPDGKPDFSGVWRSQPNFTIDITKALKPGSELVPLPWAAKLTQQRMSKDDPEANCLPAGVPRVAPYPWRIVQTPTHIFFLFEANIHSFRQIFMNRTTHPKDLNPTWYGDSIGRWDGDTLVVDTVGFNDLFWFDFAGHPHTEQLHTIERYRRIDMGTLEDEVTVEDPGAYAKPFTLLARMPLMPNQELMEYICNENNKDVLHILGKDGVDRPLR
jgi:hypothetical protein